MVGLPVSGGSVVGCGETSEGAWLWEGVAVSDGLGESVGAGVAVSVAVGAGVEGAGVVVLAGAEGGTEEGPVGVGFVL